MAREQNRPHLELVENVRPEIAKKGSTEEEVVVERAGIPGGSISSTSLSLTSEFDRTLAQSAPRLDGIESRFAESELFRYLHVTGTPLP